MVVRLWKYELDTFSGQGWMVCFCEHSSEPSCFINAGRFVIIWTTMIFSRRPCTMKLVGLPVILLLPLMFPHVIYHLYFGIIHCMLGLLMDSWKDVWLVSQFEVETAVENILLHFQKGKSQIFCTGMLLGIKIVYSSHLLQHSVWNHEVLLPVLWAALHWWMIDHSWTSALIIINFSYPVQLQSVHIIKFVLWMEKCMTIITVLQSLIFFFHIITS